MVLVDVDITQGDNDGSAVKVVYSSNGSVTSTSYEINNTQNKVYMSGSVGRYISGTNTRTFNQDARGYFLFKGITIPISSTIDDATLNLVGESSTSGIARVYGRKTNYPTVPTGQGTSIFTKPVATAFVTTTVPTTAPASFGVDIQSIIQELVNTFDYNNDNIILTMKPTAPVIPTTPVSTSVSNIIQVDAFEFGGSTIPNLIINYTAPVVDLRLLKPVSDISNTGAWEDVTFGNGDTELWDELNEITPDDDGSAILSLINPTSADTFEVKLQSTGEPPTNFNHKIKFRVRSNSGGGQIKAQLYQGTTLIAESSFETLTSSYQTFEYTLSGGEAGAITDYSDLRIRMVPV